MYMVALSKVWHLIKLNTFDQFWNALEKSEVGKYYLLSFFFDYLFFSFTMELFFFRFIFDGND